MVADKRGVVASRLATIEGHFHALHRMVDEGRGYREIVQQLVAVRSSIDAVVQVIVDDLTSDCVQSVRGSPAARSTVLELRDVVASAL
ncbi:MAG: metal-sensing transcriptional repressor [Thermoplasmata archaeon]|nr:metal-sensing transcriptional repressor [Thermoplasmata archaeon]